MYVTKVRSILSYSIQISKCVHCCILSTDIPPENIFAHIIISSFKKKSFLSNPSFHYPIRTHASGTNQLLRFSYQYPLCYPSNRF